VTHIYISIDPVAGSDNPEKNCSDFVITSICEPNTIILGMEQLNIVSTDGYEGILIDHIKRLRENQYTVNAVIVLDVEAGTGFVAGDAEAIVTNNFLNVVVMHDFKIRKPGTRTDADAKEQMYQLTRAELQFETLNICSDFITSHKNKEAMLNDLRSQLMQYARYAAVAKNPFESTKYLYSGKGDNNRQKDDLCLTLQRAIYTRKRFKYDPQFANCRL
jgi:hypothetical protein